MIIAPVVIPRYFNTKLNRYCVLGKFENRLTYANNELTCVIDYDGFVHRPIF